MSDDYKDMIDLPYKKSTRRPHMSLHDRAAQFAPFAALTGHEEAISETARLTNKRVELDEYQKTLIDEKLRSIYELLPEVPNVEITYFLPDKSKEGGEYVSVSGKIRKISTTENIIVMSDETRIPIEDIFGINCPYLF